MLLVLKTCFRNCTVQCYRLFFFATLLHRFYLAHFYSSPSIHQTHYLFTTHFSSRVLSISFSCYLVPFSPQLLFLFPLFSFFYCCPTGHKQLFCSCFYLSTQPSIHPFFYLVNRSFFSRGMTHLYHHHATSLYPPTTFLFFNFH